MVKCYKHDVELMEVRTDFEYKGVVVRGVKALRCPVCGDELLDLDQYGEIRRRIEAVIQPLKLRRRISTAGKRPALYLPEDVMKATDVKIGDEVDIYTEGRRIVIEPIEDQEPER